MRNTHLLAAASALALLASSGLAVAAPARHPARTTHAAPAMPDTHRQVRRTWVQDRSDIAADPSVRFGTLPNGMRYALMHNTTPPGQASYRLRIDAGSLMEQDDQRGLAHFMEHMAFNGSTHIPEGQLVQRLERLGLAFGADTNATTTFNDTVYKLDLPETDAETLNEGVTIMRDMVGEATIAPDALDRERGIVLSEERTRSSPGLRAFEKRNDFVMRGQLAARRLPIGDPEILRHGPASRVRAFYDAYYRPERAVFVAVGDFDVAEMERRVIAAFGDWQGRGAPGAEPDLGPVASRGQEVQVVVEPGVQSNIQLIWVAAPDLTPDSRAERRDDLARSLGFRVLNRRLQVLARGDNPPFLTAGGGSFNQLDSIQQTVMSATFQPGQWRPALTAIEQEARRAVQFGVRADELQREITEMRVALTAAAARAGTRRTPGLAEAIADSVDNQEVFTSPQTDLDLFEQAVARLTPEIVSRALHDAFPGGQGPLVSLVSPEAVEGGEAAVGQALNASRAAAVTPSVARALGTWDYTSFGAPGQVVERREDAELGTTFVRFANGLKLTVKPTNFRADSVLVSARLGNGGLDLPSDRVTPAWAANSLISGGLGHFTQEDMEQILADKTYSLNIGIGEDAVNLGGGTRTGDLELQLQVMTAYLTDPAWRREPFQRLQRSAAQAVPQLSATPGGVFGRDAPRLLHGGDARWATADAAAIEAARVEDVRALLEPTLKTAPIELTIVGDTTVDAAIAAVSRTLGALPARQPLPAPGAAAAHVVFPAPVTEPVRLVHQGRADQGRGFVGWPTDSVHDDPHESRVISLLTGVLRLRLIEELRERQGMTYSPSAGTVTSWDLPGYGYVSAGIEVPPENLPAFFTTIDRIAADLVANPVTEDELNRARRPALEALRHAQASNEYWIGQLDDAQSDPRTVPALKSQRSDMESVTAAEIQAAAARYLRADRAYRIQVVPAAPAT